MRVEIGWKTLSYGEVFLFQHEVRAAVEAGAQPDDAYSIIEKLIEIDPDWLRYVTDANVTPEFVSAVELTEED